MEAFRDTAEAAGEAPAANGRPIPWLDRTGAQQALVVAVACIVFLGTIGSPPSLMDDVDSAYAQVARGMLESGDWVSGRLNGVLYVDKPPLQVWAMAASFAIFGVHDWAARLPLALAAVVLCWVACLFGRWAFGGRAGFYAGLGLATSVGMFLFTRVRIPDAAVALTVTLALWSLLRLLEEDELRPRLWAALLWASLGVGLLLKGLVAVVLPAGAAFVYLLATRQMFVARTWRRLRPVSGLLILLAIAAPWHLLAIARNPPYFDFALDSGPGQYRGFFWRYFLNEHLLRYLGLRYPRDYNTVPLASFWLLHAVWLFPWSLFLPVAVKLEYGTAARAARARLLALCCAGFVLLFFSFSTRQEYYSLPCYPALALLIGSAIDLGGRWVRAGARAGGVIAVVLLVALAGINYAVWDVAAVGGIARTLTQNPEAYTLSLGHMQDLTLESFAYLRWPAVVIGVGLGIGAAGAWLFRGAPALLSLAAMMLFFVHAARLAMVEFDPYLSSRPLAAALEQGPPGRLIVDHEYYAFASVFFYTNRGALLLNGRVNNLEYGSNAPGAPAVFIADPDLPALWHGSGRWYLVTFQEELPRLERLVGAENLNMVASRGGKVLVTNQALTGVDDQAAFRQ
jgi:4-amino-4-deoxy-L-arabinose transferase-like glycosyltransferase